MLKLKFYQINIALLILTMFYSPIGLAQSSNPIMDLQTEILTQQLSILKDSNQNAKLRKEKQKASQVAFKKRFELGLEEITKQQLDLAQINLSLSQTDVSRITYTLQGAQEESIDLQKDINNKEEELLVAKRDELLTEGQVQVSEETLAQTKLHYELKLTQVSLLSESLQYAEQIVQLNKQWLDFTEDANQQQQQSQREQQLHLYIKGELAKQQGWLEELINANAHKARLAAEGELTDGEQVSLEVEIFYLEEKIRLNQLAVKNADSKNQVRGLLQLSSYDSSYQLTDQLGDVQAAHSYIKGTILDLAEIIILIQNQQAILSSSQASQLISWQQYQISEQLLEGLITEYQDSLQVDSRLSVQLSELSAELEDKIAMGATKRQGLPNFDKSAWLEVADQILTIPAATMNYLRFLFQHIQEKITGIAQYYYPFLFFMLIAAVLIWYIGHHYTKMIIGAVAEVRQSVSGNLVYIITQLIRRNLLGLIIFFTSLFFAFFLGINFASYALLFYLALAWFAFRAIIGIARLSLVERISDVSGADVRLYKGLRWVFLLGGIITVLTIVSYQLQLSDPTQALFIRLFLVFLVAVSLVLFKGRHVVPSLLESVIDKRRAYLIRTIHFLSVLIPLTIFVDAIIGLIGYVDIARTISYYQVILLLVVSLYMITRGLIIDLMDTAARLVIRYFKNGWLWSEALLKPLDKVLRIAIFIMAWVVLFKLYGWGREHVAVITLKNIFTYNILTFTAEGISLLNIIEFIVLVSIIIWAARWLKEVAYRWVFRNVKDSGVRYSLSNFLQYSTITIGVIITLRISGIDFTSMAVILGGLAVGLGFGLRDFANNIVSGIMLLIERPVREGDLITVSDFEGRVTHVGLRSIRVRSWDRMEIVVPNSELFNKIFTNWTHQDNIVRTVVPIKIQREENVFRVQQLIHEVLTEIPTVLKEPEPEVYLHQIDEALLEFEVRYFINVQMSRRPAIRSRVLFAIWKRFEEHNIKPPYPQQNIQLKNFPSKV